MASPTAARKGQRRGREMQSSGGGFDPNKLVTGRQLTRNTDEVTGNERVRVRVRVRARVSVTVGVEVRRGTRMERR